ncbi:iron complex transport system ATP-binding protein [Anaerosphaera aminiphila DSM 21120]|uniref:Iron complex transport system ATP-binding protein n=1 Tax=Anaerosphaera aminiphila DSM 21120 TaxID=1120995 RepID=A0A1M5R7Z4_9FIRM|nr:ATP-binding cassette domain-containing protein [Anaerosphaera aminiphila]SHH22210.1 iron complex transport system ATP-binding protein [Anaerosphaera aminiphila DSM 21120]
MIEYKNVSFIRDDRKIIDNVSFKLNSGENWAILGPNGSGKSTLFSMLMAYTVPSRGSVSAFGTEFGRGNWNTVKSQIGIVSSTMDRFDEVLNKQSVFDIVLSGIKKTIGIYDEVREFEFEKTVGYIKKFSLGNLSDKKYGNLSQGERKKVLVVRSLISNPRVLILDEPCASLDLYQRENLLRTLEKIDEQTNLIYITHDINEIMEFITNVMLIKDGKIYKSGLKEDVLTSENLSGLYDLKVELEWNGKRAWVKVEE